MEQLAAALSTPLKAGTYMSYHDFNFLVQAYNKSYVSDLRTFIMIPSCSIDNALLDVCMCGCSSQPGVMGFAMLVNVTAEQRPAYESFLAQQGPVIMSTTIKDPLTFGGPVGNKSAYLPCMYIVHTPELFGGYGSFYQNMDSIQ